MLSMVKNGQLKKVNLQLQLSLWRHGVPAVAPTWPFLGLTLCEYDRSVSDRSNETAEISDSRNTCIACIVGKREKYTSHTSQLTSSVNKVHHFFHNSKFVLYNDLFDESKGLLHDGRLSIVCEVRATTSDVVYVNSSLFDPFKPVLAKSEGNTLASDLRKIRREEGKNSDFTVVARGGREFPVHTLILSSRSAYFDVF